MINHLNYDYNSDYYRLGSMIYYIIFKKFPNAIKEQKNLTNIRVNPNEIKNYSFSCIDFLNKLIITENTKRIGYKDINELKKHNWFKNFNWEKLINKKIKSPFFNKLLSKKIDVCNNQFQPKKRIFDF